MVLIVSLRVGAVDAGAVRRAFLDQIRRDGWFGHLMAEMWDRADAVTVRRQEPTITRAGKILPFHVAR